MNIREKIAKMLLGQKASRTWPKEFNAFEITAGVATDEDAEAYVRTYGAASWVYICVRKIAQACSSVPLKFYRKNSQNEIQEVTNGEVVKLFQKVNPFISYSALMESTLTHKLLNGNSYWAIEDNGKELYPLRPDRVKIIPDPNEFIKGYVYRVNSVDIRYERDEIIHFKLFNPENDVYGMSQLSAAKSILTLDFYALNANKQLFKNAHRPGGVLEVPGNLNDAEFKRLKKMWSDSYKGYDNWHKLLILEGGGSWKETAISPKDMEFLNMRKMSREEICSIFGVPPAVVGIFEYANYANAEMQYKIFWQDTVIPHLNAIDSQLNENFIDRLDAGLYCAHDFSKVPALKENEKEKTDIAVGVVSRNIMTINEVRERYFALDPVKWGDEPQQVSTPQIGLSLNLPDRNPEPLESKKTLLLEKKIFTPEQEEAWKAFDRQLTIQEQRFYGVMKGFLKGQKERIVEAFKNSGIGKILQNGAVKYALKVSQEELDRIFNMLKENELLSGISKEELRKIIEESAKRTQGQIGVDFGFSFLTPEIESWFRKKILAMVTSVNETSRQMVADIITQALASPDGYSTGQIANQIADSLNQASDYRADRIARTEVIGAHNRGILETYVQSDVVEGKQWLPVMDDRTRDSHRVTNGVFEENGAPAIVALREYFRVGESLLMFPGDAGGEAGDVINCRCTILAVMKE